MAEEIDDDPWLDQLREALAEVSESREPVSVSDDVLVGESDVDWSSIEPADESALPTPPSEELPALDESVEPELESQPVAGPEATESDPAPPAAVDTGLILDVLSQVTRALGELTERVDAIDSAERPPMPFDQVELDGVVADAIRSSLSRAQATGAGTTRLETEVRVLEETVSRLSKKVADLNITALARDRLEKDANVERLAEAAEAVQAQVAAASEARKSFEAGVDKMLQHARDGAGSDVAWTDVMLLAHELRSRVDDLDDQQRRAMRDLAEWQTSVDDRISSMRSDLVREIRALRDPDA